MNMFEELTVNALVYESQPSFDYIPSSEAPVVNSSYFDTSNDTDYGCPSMVPSSFG